MIGPYIRWVNRKNQSGGWGVVIFPIIGDQVLLLNHYRHDQRGFFWEFPRGFGEPECHDVIDHALDELIVETGIKKEAKIDIKELVREKEYGNGTGGTTFFLAVLPEGTEINIDASEGIGSHCMLSIEELEEWIKIGKLRDLLSIKAYTLAKLKNYL